MLDGFDAALARREALGRAARGEGTDALRLWHGVSEGAPGLTVDRYGPVLLVQTWRDPLPDGWLPELTRRASAWCGAELVPVWNHRARPVDFDRWHRPTLPDPSSLVARELGLAFDARPRHRGQDPLLFLDLRALRRKIVTHRAETVLNLFSYTCGVGLAALQGGASEVWNVDFAASALEVGMHNLALGGFDPGRARFVHHDALPVLRRLAGLNPGRQRLELDLEPRAFDLVVLDPPAFSRGPWGAVDVVRDYPSLLKPALLATRPGGVLAVTHHVASVSFETFAQTLTRTAEKVGRALTIERLLPEDDFPSFDGQPPLKLAWCAVSA